MINPSFPSNESMRQNAVDSLRLLDGQSFERMDRVTRLAAAYFDVPISLISFIDRDRQWFLSRFGLNIKETPREFSFCGHAILHKDGLVVPNSAADARFFDNPLVVGAPYIAFYAGQPLFSMDGFPLGTLCLIDTRPRDFSDKQKSDLRDFAAILEEYLHNIERNIHAEGLRSDLARSEALFEQIFSQAAVGMALISLAGYWLRVNQCLCRLLRYSERELLERTFRDVTHPEDLDGDLELLIKLRDKEIDSYSREKRYFRSDGSIMWAELTVAVNRMPDGTAGNLISVVVDITERKLAEASLRLLQHELEDRVVLRTNELNAVVSKLSQEIEDRVSAQYQLNYEKERLRAITDNMPVLIGQVGPDEVYQFTNSAYQCWLDLDEVALKELTLRQFMGADAYQIAKPMIEMALQGRTVSFESELHAKSGVLMIHTTLVPCDSRGFYILSMDITELKQLQRRLEYDAGHDALTGLPNRRTLLQWLERARDECRINGKSMAVLFVDLDGFKKINDNFGHEFGDAVLREFAHLIVDCVDGPGFVARLAGDEFTVLLCQLDDSREQIRCFSEKLSSKLTAKKFIDGRLVSLSASMGVAIYSGDNTSISELMARSDKAMYRAKIGGGGLCFFDS